MERWQNKVAVVTGASAGIGAAIVLDLIKSGFIVVGLARRVERIEALKTQLLAAQQKRLHAQKCDVSDLNSVNAAFDWINSQLGGVDVLVNNAGIFNAGHLLEMQPQQLMEVVQTNVMGAVYCVQRAFKSMKERQFAGHIVLINSIAGHNVIAIPGQKSSINIYAPTKFAITAINDVCRHEFTGFGTKIKITSISPGVVDTDILIDEMRTALKDTMLRPEDVSQAVMYAIATPPHVQIHELTIKPLGEIF